MSQMLLSPISTTLNKHIELLISQQAPLSRRLFSAAHSNDVAELEEALSMGADQSHRLSNGWTALMLCCARGSDDCADMLASGPSLLLRDHYGNSCLHHAALHGALGCILVLSSLPANYELRSLRNTRGRTPLMCAALQGLPGAIEALLPGSDLGASDQDGNGPLHLAAGSGSAECALLLSNLCSPFALNAHGEIPLHLAAGGAFDATIAMLLPFGGASTKSAEGLSPLEMVPQGLGSAASAAPPASNQAPADSVASAEVASCHLLWAAMDRAERSFPGRACFSLACERGRERLASLLLDLLLADGSEPSSLAMDARLFDSTPARLISLRATSLAEAALIDMEIQTLATRSAPLRI